VFSYPSLFELLLNLVMDWTAFPSITLLASSGEVEARINQGMTAQS
jgi:hypothetical protein